MKTLSVGALLSIAAVSGLWGALGGAGEPLSQLAASPAIVATPSPLNTTVSAIALRAAYSSRPAQGSTRDDDSLTAKLSAYVRLHNGWGEGSSALSAPAVSVCSE